MASANTNAKRTFLRRFSDQFLLNRKAVFVLGVMALFQILGIRAIVVFLELEGLGAPSQSTNFIDLGGMVLIAAVEMAVLLTLWAVYKRLSDFWRKVVRAAVKTVISGAIVGGIGYLSYLTGFLPELLTLTAILVPVAALLMKYDLFWLSHNLFAIVLGSLVVAGLSFALSPFLVAPLLVGTLLWDHYAVNLSDIMGQLVEFSASAKIPNYLIIPAGIQIDKSAVTAWVAHQDGDVEKPDNLGGIIGLGDFILPSLLPLSVIVTLSGEIYTLPVMASIGGIFLSIPVLTAASSRSESMVPALPWLNSGALCGFFVGLLFTGLPALTVLGF